ncbi:hypothetical protein SOCE26_036060 [Sorangium cellulosum]|uniref:Secreted protein n=1 Tax=Sorangium cellulosum TaxID=56 RepID=A0A2L0ESB0_SORCE|nr:hypothetical protein [Sorangium cellulosum]AUX42179.1 hypothetical protein SOCE26_036060 [Sorangium cellulosum]
MKLRAALLSLGAAQALAGCSEDPTPIDVESLAQSGRSAFVCIALDRPDPAKPPVMRPLPITDCSYRTAESPDEFEIDPEGGRAELPHLYALVTQTSRGEVAVIDLTARESSVLDRDQSTPGASFLPVGAQPVDIVATPGGTATFVAVAEHGREGIFALPSSMVLRRDGCPVPSFSSWPACSLPSAPGEVLLVADPSQDGKVRSSCDGEYTVEPASPGDPAAAVGDTCATANGSLAAEGGGRQKLIVTLPELGKLAVIDAQKLLEDDVYTSGGFAACDVEQWLTLDVSLPPVTPPAYPSHGAECAEPKASVGAARHVGDARPSGLALSGDRLFVGDLDAPVIHVVDLPTPCAPRELPPLLPSSTLQPDRVVTTSRLAVSQPSPPDFRRFLYAVDAGDGSVMVFDVSDGASSRTPVAREHPEWNPFQPPDRIRLPAPVRDLAIVQREAPARLPATGVAPEGLRCDPDPALVPCDDNVASCDIETSYRTASDRRSGAGPQKLRGSFAYLLLTSGEVVIADVDDLDRACRGPEVQSALAGCDVEAAPGGTPDDLDGDGIPNFRPALDEQMQPVLDGDGNPVLERDDDCPYYPNPRKGARVDADGDGIEDTCELRTSGEASCNVVVPHALRSSDYVVPSDAAGQREPGVQSLPLLYDRSGTIVQISEESPKMRATLPSDRTAALELTLAVGARREGVLLADTNDSDFDERGLVTRLPGQPQHALAMNLEDPRVHLADEAWTVTYEGMIPEIGDTFVVFGEEVVDDDSGAVVPVLRGADARFCRRGVQSRDSVKDQLVAAGMAEAEAAERAAELADFVQITTELPAEDAAQWTDSEAKGCSFEVCSERYGGDVARPGLRIVEAFEDHLALEPSDPAVELAACCFPGQVQVSIRAAQQWIVQDGDGGFLHHVITDPATGQCRDSCDPRLARRNGRVVHTREDGPVADGAPGAFINPMFRFAITGGPRDLGSMQDMQFRFATQGAFSPIVLELADRVEELQPQSIRYIPATGELAIADGSLEGLFLLSSTSVGVARQLR